MSAAHYKIKSRTTGIVYYFDAAMVEMGYLYQGIVYLHTAGRTWTDNYLHTYDLEMVN